jgi:hypothetical protein
MNALQQLFMIARDRRWCVKPYCTTCGAREYREAIQANGPALVEALKTLRIGELRRAFPGLDVDDALRLMFMEFINPFGAMAGNMGAVEKGLEGTEAGDYLSSMRRHAREVADLRARRREFESPEAAAKRRRAKAERRQAARTARTEDKHRREADATAALEAFATLEPGIALQRILDGVAGFPLYQIRLTQIEQMIACLGELGDTELGRLRERVPVNRVQPLARLSRAIDAELKTRAP